MAQIAGSPRSGSVAAALTQADSQAGAALAACQSYDYATAVERAQAAYDGVLAAAGQINVHLAPSAYQAVRRNPADFNQALRDWIAARVGDDARAMTGAISSDGVRGLETTRCCRQRRLSPIDCCAGRARRYDRRSNVRPDQVPAFTWNVRLLGDSVAKVEKLGVAKIDATAS